MVVARRYARALYEEAERRSKVDSVDEDIALVRSTFEQSPELSRVFVSPIVSREKKLAIVGELFKQRLSGISFDFLELLIKKQREDIFPAIVKAYRAMRDEQLGIVEARARAARELSEDEQAELAAALGRVTGKKVRLNVSTDADLIGGVVIRIGDTVYDGSVRHQLERLRDKMEVGSISLN